MQDQSAASWRAVRHPRSSAPASDAATQPTGGARPTGTRQAGILTFAGNAIKLPPGTILSPFGHGPHPHGRASLREGGVTNLSDRVGCALFINNNIKTSYHNHKK